MQHLLIPGDWTRFDDSYTNGKAAFLFWQLPRVLAVGANHICRPSWLSRNSQKRSWSSWWNCLKDPGQKTWKSFKTLLQCPVSEQSELECLYVFLLAIWRSESQQQWHLGSNETPHTSSFVSPSLGNDGSGHAHLWLQIGLSEQSLVKALDAYAYFCWSLMLFWFSRARRALQWQLSLIL